MRTTSICYLSSSYELRSFTRRLAAQVIVPSEAMSQITAKRIVLRLHERYSREKNSIETAFFESQGLDPMEDYFTHICADYYSPSKLYFVLDLNCKAIPNVDPSEISLQVFKVSKDDILYVVSTEH